MLDIMLFTITGVEEALGLHKIFKPGNLPVIYQGWVCGLVIYW